MENESKSLNPFVNDAGQSKDVMPATMASDSERAIQEVQAALIIAKRFPRNRKQAMDDILQSCMSAILASNSTYSYKRGGTEVTGPTIRLAEAMAQGWGNMQYGIRELSRSNGESTVEAFAWDTERNNKVVKTFQVSHMRNTRQGSYALTDSRDIYELIANYGARRVRNCILEVIPDDVKIAALAQCEETLKASADTSPEATKRMLDKFNKEHNVNKAMLEDYIGCRIDAIKPAQVVQLRKIYNSIRDGYSKAADWFNIPSAPEPARSTLNDKLKNAQEKANAKAENTA